MDEKGIDELIMEADNVIRKLHDLPNPMRTTSDRAEDKRREGAFKVALISLILNCIEKTRIEETKHRRRSI